MMTRAEHYLQAEKCLAMWDKDRRGTRDGRVATVLTITPPHLTEALIHATLAGVSEEVARRAENLSSGAEAAAAGGD